MPPLPGAPRFDGSMTRILDYAERQLGALVEGGADGVIVENFHDVPFYPDQVPPETTAAMSAIARELVRATSLPIGVNVLRNDAHSALAVAVASGARFVRVNVHTGVAVSEQGMLHGQSHHTLRIRAALRADVAIFADVGVKHAAPLAGRGLVAETVDNTERGLADALIVSGERTGSITSPEDLRAVKDRSPAPVLIGSGATVHNVGDLAEADGFIVGTHFKAGGDVDTATGLRLIDPARVSAFVREVRSFR